MDYYSADGVVKVDEIRVNRPVAALRVGTSDFAGLTNEKIKVYLESPQSDDQQIIPDLKLKPIMMMEGFGEGTIWQHADGQIRANVSIGDGGAYSLQDKEFIIVSMSGLKAAQTYDVGGLESRTQTNKLKNYGSSIVLADLPNQVIPLAQRRLAVIENYSAITEFQITPLPGMGKPYKANIMDLLCIQHEDNDILVSNGGANEFSTYDADFLLVDCAYWESVYIEKAEDQKVTIYYQDI